MLTYMKKLKYFSVLLSTAFLLWSCLSVLNLIVDVKNGLDPSLLGLVAAPILAFISGGILPR